MSEVFENKSIWKMEEVGAAIKEVIHYPTIRGKFSSVHPDLVAVGITRVELGEEGLHFITKNYPGIASTRLRCRFAPPLFLTFLAGANKDPVNPVADLELDEELLLKAIALSLEEEEEEEALRLPQS